MVLFQTRKKHGMSDDLRGNPEKLIARIQRLKKISMIVSEGPEREDILNKIVTLEAMAGTSENASTVPSNQKEKGPMSARPSLIRRMFSRKGIVFCGFALFLLSGLFPPWNSVVDYKAAHLEANIGYHPIVAPPYDLELRGIAASPKIDLSRLGLQWLLIMATTGTMLYLFQPERKTRE